MSAIPSQREIRGIVQDMKDGNMDTNLRFGRKPQWDQETKKMFILTLLEGKIPIDPISVSNKNKKDRVINGNNRLRAIASFVNNEYCVECLQDDVIHYYYYSEIPETIRQIAKRFNRSHVLTHDQRMAFDRHNIHLNVRNNLNENDEIHWYRTMNKNMKPHTEGQLLTTILCCPDTDNKPFVDSFFKRFPQIKSRFGETEHPDDNDSVGIRLSEKFDIDINLSDEDNKDKRETAMLSLAQIHNLVVNGHSYDNGFKGEFDEATANINYNQFLEILEMMDMTDDFKDYLHSYPSSRSFVPNIWTAPFLLGNIAWTIANKKQDGIDAWNKFLDGCTRDRIENTYIAGDEMTSRRKMKNSSGRKYEVAWECVYQWYSERE